MSELGGEPSAHGSETATGDAALRTRPDVRLFLEPGFESIGVFADLLIQEGKMRGLLGPRETHRLWDRHVLNSAAAAALIPDDGVVVDVGSGAGLPGLVVAAMRPHADVVLIEPMQRRVEWLEYAADAMGLANVTVVATSAQEQHGRLWGTTVTARAVAAMKKLIPMCWPLVAPGGHFVALKGQRAQVEVNDAKAVIKRLTCGDPEIRTLPTVSGASPTTAVILQRSR